jgi:PEP-CTERM motif
MTPRNSIAAGLLAFVSATSAHATVVAGGWSVGGDTSDSGTTLGAFVYQTVEEARAQSNGGTFSSWAYDYQRGTIKLTGSALDEGATFFAVKPGDVINQAYVDARRQLPQPLKLNATVLLDEQELLNGNPQNAERKEFWLGVATTHSSDPGFSWNNLTRFTSFGWAHIRTFADGRAELLSSAMAFRESSIVAGTLPAVPEPGTWALMGLGLVGMAGVIRRRQGSAA